MTWVGAICASFTITTLGPAGARDRGLDPAIGVLTQRWPGLLIHRGAPPAVDDVARMLGDRAREVMRRPRPLRPVDTAIVLVGLAAWQPAALQRPRVEDKRAVLMPTLGVLLAIGLMTYDHFERLNTAALILTANTINLLKARAA